MVTTQHKGIARISNVCVALSTALTLVLSSPLVSGAEQQPPARGTIAAPARTGPTVGVQGFGLAGLSFPIASESLTTVGLNERPQELGGGVQVTNFWRGLFVQVAASRWRGDGSRVFIDSRGARFDLGIPLHVTATHADVGAGWRFARKGADWRRNRVVPYIGVGVGVADYSETSSFAESGEDFSERATSYSGFGGVEVRLTSWLGVGADARYRYVKGILGRDGVSAALGDDSLDGPSASARLVFGWFGDPGSTRAGSPATPEEPRSAPVPARRPADVDPVWPPVTVAVRQRGLAVVDTPVRIAPDRRREPLAVIERGTQMLVVGEEAEWFRVEFRDPRWGTRVGFVERAHVKLFELP
jgi:opacity protein-like surface antigen